MPNNNNVENNRPKLHFTPPANWMNDPNGLVYYNGEYHLFYQYHPFGDQWGPMHWGHAVSTDLIQWEHLPIALAPDENGMIFSGSALVDWNDSTGFFDGKPGLVAVFTHHDHPAESKPVESQSIAYSQDFGRTWIKYENNPVLKTEKYSDFRDPKVFWHHDTNQWIMILATGETVCLYNSLDLKEWKFSSEFGNNIGCHDGVWECPDLFPLAVDGDETRMRWVMLVSVANNPDFAEGSRTQYFTGHFDGFIFTPDNESRRVRWIDSGRDNYACVNWSDIPAEDKRRIYVGWMNNWKYADKTPSYGWRGAMTIPRELSLKTLNDEIVLLQRPVNELVKLRTPALQIEGESINTLNSIIKDYKLQTYEIEADFQLSEGLEQFGLKLRTSKEEETVVGYSVSEKTVFVDRTHSTKIDIQENFPGIHKVSLKANTGSVKFHIIVDINSIEVFVNDGLIVFTDLIYPSMDSTGICCYSYSTDEIRYSFKLYGHEI